VSEEINWTLPAMGHNGTTLTLYTDPALHNAQRYRWRDRRQCRINYGSGGSPEPGPLNSGVS